MRMMTKVQMDTEAAVGPLPTARRRSSCRTRSDFGPENGVRTAFIVFDMEGPSQPPPISEPLFGTMEANIQLVAVMDQADLQKGLGQLGG